MEGSSYRESTVLLLAGIQGQSSLFYLRNVTKSRLYTTAIFLNGFKVSDIDQLILALEFKSGVTLV